MGWVSINGIEKTVYNQALKLGEGQYIYLKSFKKDRVISITKNNDSFIVDESGFEKNEFTLNDKDIKHFIKRLIDKEFPRSHQLMLTMKNSKS